MRLPLLLLLAGPLFACASPSRPVQLVAADATGARLHDLRVERSERGWILSGWLQGPWLRTASRREVGIEALGAGDAPLVSSRITARRYAQSDSKSGVDSARFEVELPASTARVRLRAEPR